ncbi:hypothetical protein AB0L06_17295 [Spirillospora sp. NPDC052269]
MKPNDIQPASLVGYHVVEIGLRQAWPFVTLAPGDETADETAEFGEVRLYIDSAFTVRPSPPDTGTGAEDDERLWLLRLAEVLYLTVDSVSVATDASLSMRFAGDITLEVSGQGAPWTIAEVWWLGRP